MSTTGGFWPGEAPPATEERDVQEPEAAVAGPEAEPLGWPEPHEQEPEAQVEPAVQVEPAAAVAEPEPADEDDAEEKPAVAPAGHVPGELDIPDSVAVLEGSPSGADRTVGV